jgi:hypothetical protein
MDALIAELSKPEYSELSDQQAADAINAMTVQTRQLVQCSEIIRHATIYGYRHKLTKAASNDAHPCQGLAIDILPYIDSSKTQSVDMDLPETKAMLGAMVQCGFASQAVVDGLDALATVTIKWTESVGLPEIGVGLVRNARSKMRAE